MNLCSGLIMRHSYETDLSSLPKQTSVFQRNHIMHSVWFQNSWKKYVEESKNCLCNCVTLPRYGTVRLIRMYSKVCCTREQLHLKLASSHCLALHKQIHFKKFIEILPCIFIWFSINCECICISFQDSGTNLPPYTVFC